MPKIIENAREQILEETKRQIAQRGYAKTTIRSVASACGIAAGTVYNYFPSKEMLVASFMAQDWQELTRDVLIQRTDDAKAYLAYLSCSLRKFSDRHSALFTDEDAKRVFAAVFSQRHAQLRDQLAALVSPVCGNVPGADPGFVSQFVAESLLTWTMAGTPFESIWAVLCSYIKENEEEEKGS